MLGFHENVAARAETGIRFAISTIPALHVNLAPLHALRDCQFNGPVALNADPSRCSTTASGRRSDCSQQRPNLLQYDDQLQENSEYPIVAPCTSFIEGLAIKPV
ncbi:hypothetical protein BKG83_13375 [Mycobacteroides chelonae]|uniref:Uncharacterized protein n=1 Tax=Mycobacteroides chelonae TaxID=1774 RepID=A0A1S1LYS8_MYCCH|nr:hypothetical protein BKG66_20065 [Mycobacteroides chelonae]OHT68699.1 hypothetical protein BKG67_18615 [Mycobacteroides chelonae]OHT83606.1 hypothetical protein BKG70_18775 [Mycobacteroides chelonae]OHU55277.1 hypothetical protein BKG83_13375 [Mycobacteroides chelonae]OHU75798.1 hypothetical protein BKG84_26650 [Mycobacteroides chelonae]